MVFEHSNRLVTIRRYTRMQTKRKELEKQNNFKKSSRNDELTILINVIKMVAKILEPIFLDEVG